MLLKLSRMMAVRDYSKGSLCVQGKGSQICDDCRFSRDHCEKLQTFEAKQFPRVAPWLLAEGRAVPAALNDLDATTRGALENKLDPEAQLVGDVPEKEER